MARAYDSRRPREGDTATCTRGASGAAPRGAARLLRGERLGQVVGGGAHVPVHLEQAAHARARRAPCSHGCRPGRRARAGSAAAGPGRSASDGGPRSARPRRSNRRNAPRTGPGPDRWRPSATASCTCRRSLGAVTRSSSPLHPQHRPRALLGPRPLSASRRRPLSVLPVPPPCAAAPDHPRETRPLPPWASSGAYLAQTSVHCQPVALHS